MINIKFNEKVTHLQRKSLKERYEKNNGEFEMVYKS